MLVSAMAIIFALPAFVACERDEADSEVKMSAVESSPMESSSLETADPPLPPPRIPQAVEDFRPSMARLAHGEVYDAQVYGDIEGCASCHAEEAHQWSDSAHAFSSLSNPFYRFAFDEFFESEGEERINFCAGCHDLAPMFAGDLSSNLEPDDLQGHIGITCVGCHGVTEATTDGNASFVLSTAEVPVPVDGDEESLQRHLAAVGGPAELGDTLCVSCHRAFLAPDTGHAVAISGINDFTPWHRSPYAGNLTTRIDDDIEPQGCVDCHMPPRLPDGGRSHRFAGGHSTLARAIGSEEQLQAIREMVEGAALIDIAAYGFGSFEIGAQTDLQRGQRLWLDVVVFNENVGHHFPGGARDLRDTYIEVVVRDANGEVLAASGLDHGHSAAEPLVHRLRVLLTGHDGLEVENHLVHQFRTAVFNHTIAPRDAAVVRFAWQVPDEEIVLAEPLTIETRLLHRRLHRALADNACEQSRQPRGRAFIEATARYLGKNVDPCLPQPILEVSRASLVIGSESDASRSPVRPAWRRAFEHGMGLRHARQESVHMARTALEYALALQQSDSESDGDIAANQRAQILFMLGSVATRQGRTDEAMGYFDQAEALVGPHPAIDHARGQALVGVFRNQEAQQWLSGTDDRTARLMATASGSISDPHRAYEAARQGLLLEPRDPDLLRTQSLALRRLDVPQSWAEEAWQAFLDFRHDEEASGVRSRCSDADAECLLERMPVHVHELQSSPSRPSRQAGEGYADEF